jgi:LPS export ABC transporter protein LptC
LKNSLNKRFFLVLLLVIAGCSRSPQETQDTKTNTSTPQKLETSLVFNNFTLEQSNDRGQTLWKIAADKAVYTQDKKTASVDKITGNMFQDGKVFLHLSAEKGIIQNNGEKVILEKRIIVTDKRNQAVITSEKAEWFPKKDLLIVPQDITGNDKNLKVLAKQGQYFTKDERLELVGQIVATSQDPPLQLKTDRLSWLIPQQKVIGDRPLAIDRYQEKTITDRIQAGKGEVDLKTKIAILEQNVELTSSDPPVQVATNQAIWDTKARIVRSPTPVQIVHTQQQMTVIGNQGKVDLVKQVADLVGGIKGESKPKQATIYAKTAIWNIPTEIIEAEGNVIYQQADPPLNLTGPKAVGKLQENSIVVSGNNGDRVVTEIVP